MTPWDTLKSGLWEAPGTEALSPFAKYLYVYLVTTSDNILGVGDRSSRRMAFETGMTEHEVENALAELSDKGLVVADGQRVAIIKYMRILHYVMATRYDKPLRKRFGDLHSDVIKRALIREYPHRFDSDDMPEEGDDDGEISYRCD